jgi:hypothetical protein
MPNSDSYPEIKLARIAHLSPGWNHWVEAYRQLYKGYTIKDCSCCGEPVLHPPSHGLKYGIDTDDRDWLFVVECTMNDNGNLKYIISAILEVFPCKALDLLVTVSSYPNP